MSGKKRPQARLGKRLRCSRCGVWAPKDLMSKAAEHWTGKWEAGRLVLILCPPCQTPVETAEAVVNAAELTAGRADGGRFMPDPVLCVTGTQEDFGTVLYGQDHLHRVRATRQAEELSLVWGLPPETRCVPLPGGVMIYQPDRHAAP